MPRKPIEIQPKLESLSILDESGEVDESLDPHLDPECARLIYRLMVTGRTLDHRLINLQRQGRMGTYAPCRGQEATHCASTILLEPEDWLVYAFREPISLYHRGWPLEAPMRFWGGYEEGCAAPEGVNDLPISVPVASQIPHAMGIAWAMKLRDDPHAVLCYCGDGATSEGDFHESLNFAGVYRLPCVFLVQNNQWAISIPRKNQTASQTIAQKALAYGFDGIQVDGNDPLSVYVATKEALDKARSGGGPTLIEAVTYRMSVHTTADDPTKYRSDEEVKKWEKRDPILRFGKYLVKRGVLDSKSIDKIEADAVADVAAAVERYESCRDVDPLDCFEYLYAELPAELVEQRKEFAEALANEGHGKGC
ncbi:MAG: pyruvate dehydrogenase (acetyl-transferring) E1 component subunit alpha [Planctomycetes bacterium]|nr:pyruvate dehydrogenase (acetyl-transferring) E1 component subunit alpha [Planctomycetota bacterium]